MDFERTSADTGFNVLDSVQPVSNGEKANQTVFRRPTENVRNRTEIIRAFADALEAAVGADRGLAMASLPTAKITWPGAKPGADPLGKFTLTAGQEIRIIPIGAAAEYNNANHIPARLRKELASSEYFTTKALMAAALGANYLQLELWYTSGVTLPGNTPVTTVTGSKVGGTGAYDPAAGPVLVRVQLSHNGANVLSTWTQVVNAINGDVLVGTWLQASVHFNQAGNAAEAIAVQYLWETVPAASIVGIGALDAQGFIIPAAALVTFFNTGGNGEAGLYEGDSVAINYASQTERLQQAGGTVITASQLIVVHRDETTPVSGPFSYNGNAFKHCCVPLCKVIDGRLVFFNGASIAAGAAHSGSLVPDSTLRSELAETSGTPYGDFMIGGAAKNAAAGQTFGVVLGTLNAQLQSIINQLALNTGTAGEQKVGAAAKTSATGGKTLSVGGLHTQLQGILDHYGDHIYNAGTPTDKHALKHILGRLSYTLGSSASLHDYQTFAALLAAHADDAVIEMHSSVTECVTFAPATYGFTVRGAGANPEDTELKSETASTPAVTISSTGYAGIVFENMEIRQNAAGAPAVLIDADITTGMPFGEHVFVTFRNCHISKSALVTGGQPLVKTRANVRFENCLFYSYGPNDNNTAIVEVYANTAGQKPTVELVNCKAYSIGKILTCSGSQTAFGRLVIRSCAFGDSVGYSTGSTCGLLIDAGSKTFDFVDIAENVYKTAASPTYGGARFCDVKGTYGAVRDNVIQAPIGTPADASAGAVVRTFGIRVDGNYIDCGRSYGVYASTDTDHPIEVCGNKLINVGTPATVAASYGIYISGGPCDVHDNDIEFQSTTDVTGLYGVYAASNSRVHHNYIHYPSGATTASGGTSALIYCGGGPLSVTGNVLSGDKLGGGSGNSDGIVTNTRTSVSGNNVRYCKRGVYVNAGDACVSGNVATENDYGVYASGSSTGSTVSGNTLSENDKGIYVAANNKLGFAGNTLDGNTTADIDVPVTSNNIGIGVPGACVYTSNLYTNVTTH